MAYDNAYDPAEDDTDETGLPTFAVGASGGLGAYQNAYEQQLKSLNDMYAMTERALRARQEASKGDMQRERLLSLAAALGQPTRTGSFGETLGNFNAAMVGTLKAQRERKEALEDTLLKQQQERLLLANRLYGQYLTKANAPGKTEWSESMGQFISQRNPVPTKNTVRAGGLTLTQYTDGTLRLVNPDKTVSVYSPEGVKIKDIPAGGAE